VASSSKQAPNTVGARNKAGNKATGAVVLSDGTAFLGQGAGHQGVAVGELCFNTAMTGYQEILTDPSYAEQIICFTFPHIGNVGATPEDEESASPQSHRAARGAVLRAAITAPSSWRAQSAFDPWLADRSIVAVTGVDTRALTCRIREHGVTHCVIAHDPNGDFDLEALAAQARDWAGIKGADLAKDVSTADAFAADENAWEWPAGVTPIENPTFNVVVLDYGVKASILRRLGAIGAHVDVLPANAKAADVLALKPDGVLLANGPGDPAATAAYAGAEIRTLTESGVPLLAICLGHQMLAIALGATTLKMAQGHHGANHPVKELASGQVQIVSMNHGFAVDGASLPNGVEETHVSLFDGTNCGLQLTGKPVFSVQHHPEASPGPHDAFGLFDRFADLMTAHKAGSKAQPAKAPA